MSEAAAQADLLDVVLPGFPLRLFQRWQQRVDGLMREFALISLSTEHGSHDVPRRLVGLADEVTATYAGAAAQAAAARDAAMARGDAEMDLVYRVPRAAAAHAARFEEILVEADHFCEAAQLLILAAPVEFVAFRHWFFGNVVRQCHGYAPVRWMGPLD